MKGNKIIEYSMWGFLAVFFIAAFLISGSSTAQDQMKKITVVVDVFSGRPNPSFEISDANEIVNLQNSLKVQEEVVSMTAADIRAFDRLGYRGILVSNSAGIEGIPPFTQFLNGKVRTFASVDRTDAKFFKDAARMEKYYLGLAKQRGILPEGLIEKGIVPNPDTM